MMEILTQIPYVLPFLLFTPLSPIIITLLVTLFNASSWLFWIVTSLIISLIQLFYVVYQFVMISLDMFFLSALKTFATIRSQLLYYSFLLTGRGKKRGGRREWRLKLEKAEGWDDYQKIEIGEHANLDPAVGGNHKKYDGDTDDPNDKWREGLTSKTNGQKKQLPDKIEQLDCSSEEAPQSPGITRRNSVTVSHPTKPTSPLSKSKSYVDLSKTRHNSDPTLPHSHSNSELHSSSLPQNNNDDATTSTTAFSMTSPLLQTTTARLSSARAQARAGDSSSLKFLLSGIVKRNHLSVDDALIDDARSVAERGSHALSREHRSIIKDYIDEVELCLDWLAEETTTTTTTSDDNETNDDGDGSSSHHSLTDDELSERLHLARKLRQNTGYTALMLSGGGAQAMYHLGTIRGLIESGVYANIGVISGTSGGSISAAMCALMTDEELLKDVCVDTVSTDFRLNGAMKRGNIRWFPKLMDMGAYWMKHRLMVDSKEFRRCCDFYYGDVTFEEAFKKTRKHVCITVSASRSTGGSGGAQRLLLNHISTPHVTLSSAVAASCALPGVMAPAKLMTKDGEGRIEPFEVDGMEWIDGSVQADLPFRRISTLFNVSNYIVCQVNFHVVPFLNKPHHPNVNSLYWRLFQTFEWDIRSRTLNLSRLGLFPRIFGQDVSKVFKQKYYGNITIVPRFTRMHIFGLKVLVNPTVDDMKIYLKNGAAAAWPYVECIEQMLRLETAIDKCIHRLKERFRDNLSFLEPDLIIGDSSSTTGGAASSSLSVVGDIVPLIKKCCGSGTDAELLARKVKEMEDEILRLRRRVKAMGERESVFIDDKVNGDKGIL